MQSHNQKKARNANVQKFKRDMVNLAITSAAVFGLLCMIRGCNKEPTKQQENLRNANSPQPHDFSRGLGR